VEVREIDRIEVAGHTHSEVVFEARYDDQRPLRGMKFVAERYWKLRAPRVLMAEMRLFADAAPSSGVAARRTLGLATAVKRTRLRGTIAG
jgi:hypothetical protein